jgi:hypothetical protein
LRTRSSRNADAPEIGCHQVTKAAREDRRPGAADGDLGAHMPSGSPSAVRGGLAGRASPTTASVFATSSGTTHHQGRGGVHAPELDLNRSRVKATLRPARRRAPPIRQSRDPHRRRPSVPPTTSARGLRSRARSSRSRAGANSAPASTSKGFGPFPQVSPGTPRSWQRVPQDCLFAAPLVSASTCRESGCRSLAEQNCPELDRASGASPATDDAGTDPAALVTGYAAAAACRMAALAGCTEASIAAMGQARWGRDEDEQARRKARELLSGFKVLCLVPGRHLGPEGSGDRSDL